MSSHDANKLFGELGLLPHFPREASSQSLVNLRKKIRICLASCRIQQPETSPSHDVIDVHNFLHKLRWRQEGKFGKDVTKCNGCLFLDVSDIREDHHGFPDDFCTVFCFSGHSDELVEEFDEVVLVLGSNPTAFCCHTVLCNVEGTAAARVHFDAYDQVWISTSEN